MGKKSFKGVWIIIALAAVMGFMAGCADPTNSGDDNPSTITYTVAQTGGEDGVKNSTGIVFTFSASVDSLNLTTADITVKGKAYKDSATLTGSGKNWTLSPITVNAAGTATVSIAKDGIETETKNITVYKEGEFAPETLTITWHLNGGAESIYAKHPIQIDKGKTLDRPFPDPAKTNHAFRGWYKDSACTQLYDFASLVTANLDLYAKWETPKPVPGSTLAAKLAWVLDEDNVQDEQLYIIEVSANEAITPHTLSYTNRSNITIILQGSGSEKIITLSDNGSLFTVERDVTLVLDNNITLQGHRNNNRVLVMINQYGNLIMNTGAKITGNTHAVHYNGSVAGMVRSFGGGVYVNQYGTFTMTGGEISHNTASVSATTSSSFMSVSSYGGGVLSVGTFTMTGGTISGNTATSSTSSGTSYSDGGGVYVAENFRMTGGTISGNTASSSSPDTSYSYGGGVYAERFTMTGGTISGNTAVSSSGNAKGGGVYASSSISKSGGTIYGYSANDTNSNVVKNSSGAVLSDQGHAVYVSRATQRRETTAGPTVNLDSDKSGTAGGWEN